MEDSFAYRLKRARKFAGLTQADLAAAVGIDQTSISNLERGRSLGTSFSARLAEACSVSAYWLETGNGEMLPAQNSAQAFEDLDRMQAASLRTGPELRGEDATDPVSGAASKVLAMLAKSRGLSEAARSQIAQTVDAAVEERVQERTGNVIRADFARPGLVGDEIRIAHYNIRAALGNGQVVPDYPEMLKDLVVSERHLRELGISFKQAADLKMLTGWGQSMAPTIQHLDPLIVDVSIREFLGDAVYAFTWQGHFYVKRLQVVDAEHYEMISDNPAHKARVIRMDETYIQALILLVWNAKRV